VGELFTSFDDAWSAFVARDEPLESFWNEFPDDPAAVLDVWLAVPPPVVKREALRIQGELDEIAGLRIVPHHFLHLSLPEEHVDALAEHGPFIVECTRLNCFPAAVVAEADSPALTDDAPTTFLPHVSLAYVELPIHPQPVGDALVPLRDAALGSFEVDELLRVRVPAAKSTVLQPWTVLERLPLTR
jgi:hypothetical protein